MRSTRRSTRGKWGVVLRSRKGGRILTREKRGRFKVAKRWPNSYKGKKVGRFEVSKRWPILTRETGGVILRSPNGGRIHTKEKGVHFGVAKRWPNWRIKL